MKPYFLHPKFWFTWLGLLLLRLLSSLPWPLVALLSDGLGAVAYKLFKSRRDIAEKNIAACFPQWPSEKVSATAKRSFQLSVQAMFFTGVAWWASEKRYKKLVEFDSSALDQLMVSGKNVIVLTPHFVGLETAGVFMSIGRPFMTMYQYAKNKLIQHNVVTKRGRFGGHLVERKEPLRKMLKLLRKGIPLYYLPDQDAGRKGRFAPFFGVKASSFDMLGKMTTMSNAVVIPCTVEIKDKGKGVRITLHAALQDFPKGDDAKDTEMQNKVVEDMIRKMPEQYLWAHKRFKSRPDGEKPFYEA